MSSAISPPTSRVCWWETSVKMETRDQHVRRQIPLECQRCQAVPRTVVTAVSVSWADVSAERLPARQTSAWETCGKLSTALQRLWAKWRRPARMIVWRTTPVFRAAQNVSSWKPSVSRLVSNKHFQVVMELKPRKHELFYIENHQNWHYKIVFLLIFRKLKYTFNWLIELLIK